MPGSLHVVILVLRAGVAAILVAAGAAKFADLRSFQVTLVRLGLPKRFPNLVAGMSTSVPTLEVALGLGVASGSMPLIMDIVALILTCSFVVVVIIGIRRAPGIGCRCFGALRDSQFDAKSLTRTLLLSACCGVVLIDQLVSPSVGLSNFPVFAVFLCAGFGLFGLCSAVAARSLAEENAGRTR